MKVEGHWYAPGSSARHVATLAFDGDAYRLDAWAPSGVKAGEPSEPPGSPGPSGSSGSREESIPTRRGEGVALVVSDRLGNTARRLTLPDGSLFETLDNAAIDAWLAGSGHAGARALRVHRLEGSWPMIGASLVATVVLVFAAFRWGLPAAAERISDRLPVAAHESVGRGALATMDRLFLGDSELGDDERAKIRERFEGLVETLPDDGFDLTLHFRSLGGVPNAFALPGGDVVVTDALVALAEAPEELDSVLLHEIGHVHERHGMRHAIQASAVTVVVSLAIGDVGALGELATAVPVFLLQSSYSRASESEADEFAFAAMARTGRDPRHFAAIIRRLGEVETDEESGEGRVRADWMSTHPDTERRAQRALERSRAFETRRSGEPGRAADE